MLAAMIGAMIGATLFNPVVAAENEKTEPRIINWTETKAALSWMVAIANAGTNPFEDQFCGRDINCTHKSTDCRALFI